MKTNKKITDQDLRNQLAKSILLQKANMTHSKPTQREWYLEDMREMVLRAKNSALWQQQTRNVARISELDAKIKEVKQQISKLINPFGYEAYMLNSLWTKYEKELGEMEDDKCLNTR